jgi:N-acetylglucosamine malate deacetylase 1
VGEYDFLKWQNDSGLGRRVSRVPELDLGLALDGEYHLVVVVDQIGPKRLGSDLMGGPFYYENDSHPVLGGREIRSTELVEDAGHVELAVVADVGLIAGQSENQIHGEAKMTGCLLVALSHPDDEVGCAGTIALHRAQDVRVVLLFLTRGEMTESLGPLSAERVGVERVKHAEQVAKLLDCEVRFLDFADTRIEISSDAMYRVGRAIAEIKPDAVITWGDAWMRGMRHPDHQATGEIVRGGITIARMKRAVAPIEPHRGAAAVFTLRDRHSALPCAALDVSAVEEKALEVGRFYKGRVGWPDEGWHRQRLEMAGWRWGVKAAEEFDAWESAPGLRKSLLGDPVSV